MKKIICFDLEGPLSPQDHAFEAMKLVPNGEKLFKEISRFDDILALKGQKNHQPGDTLKLIAPFLILGGVTPADLKKVSQKAKLVPGAKELVKKLKKEGWKIFIISTSYKQHALNIAGGLGVSQEDVFCTKFPPKVVMGGKRKVKALRLITKKLGVSLKDIVVVGDSITDFQMLKAVKEAGGLAIVFNGNQYALPYGTIGVASASLMDIKKILEAWLKGGLEAVKKVPHCEDLKIHQKFRQLVRGQAAKLG